MNIPRQFSIVRFKKNKYSQDLINKYYHVLLDKHFIFFGEIPNQLGHCILWTIGNYVGKPEFFRHTDDFEEVPEDEL